MTAQTAEDLLVELGQRVVLRPDLGHRSWAFIFGEELDKRVIVEVAGIIELTDVEDGYWFGDPSLHRPRIDETADFRMVFATGLFRPESYRELLRGFRGVHYDYRYWYPVESDRVEIADARTLLAAFDQLGTPEGRVVTLVPDVIGRHLAQRALTVALLSTAFAGVVVVAAVAVWVLTTLTVRRQEHTWRLVLERGVGRSRVVALGAVHGLVVAGPAALLAAVIAVALVDAAPLRPVVVVVAVLAVAVVAATVGATGGDRGGPDRWRGPDGGRRPSVPAPDRPPPRGGRPGRGGGRRGRVPGAPPGRR